MHLGAPNGQLSQRQQKVFTSYGHCAVNAEEAVISQAYLSFLLSSYLPSYHSESAAKKPYAFIRAIFTPHDPGASCRLRSRSVGMFLENVLWVARQAGELVIFSLIFTLGLINLYVTVSECSSSNHRTCQMACWHSVAGSIAPFRCLERECLLVGHRFGAPALVIDDLRLVQTF